MKILACHDYYQRKGGEDEVFEAETALLESRGHQIVRHVVHNDSISGVNSLGVGLRASWSRNSYRTLRELIRRERPRIAHFYNTFPLLSPSVYYAAKVEGLPVIQSLHNFRMLCLNATLYRDGRPCEDCAVRKLPGPGILHACYHSSTFQSIAVAVMNTVHRGLGTFNEKIDLFLLGSTETARRIFIRAGIEPSRILLKPNFTLPDPGVGGGNGGYMLFVGRFDEEKGILDLLSAWDTMQHPPPLKIVGDGPLTPQVQIAAQSGGGIEWLGRLSLEKTMGLMQEAQALIFPSRWYEAMPRTIIDSFAAGTPVIGSNVGATGEMITDGETGFLFEGADPADLAATVSKVALHPQRLAVMRGNARREFESRYTAEANYELLMAAYASVLRQASV